MDAAILILAAGRSSRMGCPKQLLAWSGSSLVRHVAQRALAVPNAAVYLVTGAYSDRVIDEVRGLNVKPIFNPGYSEGLGNSLATGVRHILDVHPQVPTHILVQLADQPAVTTEYLVRLLGEAERGTDTVATAYGQRAGVPAVFPASRFSEIVSLGGDAGAGPLLNSGDYGVQLIHPSFDLFDIDTPEDYRRHEGDS